MFEAVLFDLDGTLADTAPDMARTVNLMRTRRGLAPVPLAQVRPHVSRGARGMVCSAFGITTNHADFGGLREEFLALYGDNLCVDSRLFPGMEDLLGSLESRAIAWGVVTNKHERFARPLIEALGLGTRAAVLVGGDTCARAKPFPDPLIFAAQRLRVDPSHALYVGDDQRDVQAARRQHAGAGRELWLPGNGPPADTWERMPSWNRWAASASGWPHDSRANADACGASLPRRSLRASHRAPLLRCLRNASSSSCSCTAAMTATTPGSLYRPDVLPCAPEPRRAARRVRITDRHEFHPSLAPLMPAWEAQARARARHRLPVGDAAALP